MSSTLHLREGTFGFYEVNIIADNALTTWANEMLVPLCLFCTKCGLMGPGTKTKHEWMKRALDTGVSGWLGLDRTTRQSVVQPITLGQFPWYWPSSAGIVSPWHHGGQPRSAIGSMKWWSLDLMVISNHSYMIWMYLFIRCPHITPVSLFPLMLCVCDSDQAWQMEWMCRSWKFCISYIIIFISMMTSWHRNAFCFIGSLWSGIRSSPLDSPHNGPVMCNVSLLLAWAICWINSKVGGDSRRQLLHQN